jgi:hypothetical protein
MPLATIAGEVPAAIEDFKSYQNYRNMQSRFVARLFERLDVAQIGEEPRVLGY